MGTTAGEDKVYRDEEMLMISGIQHFVFCPRQWYLIYIEQCWAENELTAEGEIVHTRVDDPTICTKGQNLIEERHTPIACKRLGIYGFTDVIEWQKVTDKDPNAITHPHYRGLWSPFPVEYKRGKPKRNLADILQLCAEAVALEEMLHCHIPKGYLFYHTTQHRLEVELDAYIREQLEQTVHVMHQHFKSGMPIMETFSAKCKQCSLIDRCAPSMPSYHNASKYIHSIIMQSI